MIGPLEGISAPCSTPDLIQAIQEASMGYLLSPRRYARMAKRAIRLMAGRDVLYKYDIHPKTKHIGSIYGGWMIIPELLHSNSVAYSFGVGNDVSFDLELIRRFGLKVHGFDPSPIAIQWLDTQCTSPKYIFHPWGLGSRDTSAELFAPISGGMYSLHSEHMSGELVKTRASIRRLATIAKELGTKVIDILKIDIEGAELDILPDIVESAVPIRQLVLEFHHRIGIGTLDTTGDSVNRLKEAGFQLFHVSETSSEFSFLHKGASVKDV
jgi:FkbM family methyltransferase